MKSLYLVKICSADRRSDRHMSPFGDQEGEWGRDIKCQIWRRQSEKNFLK